MPKETMTPKERAQSMRDWLESGLFVPFRDDGIILFRVPAAPGIEYIFMPLDGYPERSGEYGIPSDLSSVRRAMIWDRKEKTAYSITMHWSHRDYVDILTLGSLGVPPYIGAIESVRTMLFDYLETAVQKETIPPYSETSCRIEDFTVEYDALTEYVRYGGSFIQWFAPTMKQLITSMTKGAPYDNEIIEAIQDSDGYARDVFRAMLDTVRFKSLTVYAIAIKRLFWQIANGEGVDAAKVDIAGSMYLALNEIQDPTDTVEFIVNEPDEMRTTYTVDDARKYAECLGNSAPFIFDLTPIELVQEITHNGETIWHK